MTRHAKPQKPTKLLDISEEDLLKTPSGILFKDCSDELGDALSSGAQALAEEDAQLLRHLTKQNLPKGVRRGLTYKLFETTLNYLIFKKCLSTKQRIRWEWPYPNSTKMVDLLLTTKDGKPHTAIEAKWWLSNSKLAIGSLQKDIDKLREFHTAPTRVLLCFWWSKKGSWNTQTKTPHVRSDYSKINSGLKTLNLQEKPLFIAAFETHVKDNEQWYFAMLALRTSTN